MTAIVDMYPAVFRQKYRRELFLLAMSFMSFLVGLIMLMEVIDVCHYLFQSLSEAKSGICISRKSSQFHCSQFWLTCRHTGWNVRLPAL